MVGLRIAVVCLRSLSASYCKGLPVRCYSVARPEAVNPESTEAIEPHWESPFSGHGATSRSAVPFSSPHAALTLEDMENYELVKSIATATDLESPRLFVHALGKPLVGDLGAIHPREVRWQPYSSSAFLKETEFGQRMSKISGFSPDIFVFLQRRRDFTIRGFFLWQNRRSLAARRSDQKYLPERVNALGPELAAAHFAVHRGARVKFYDIDKWYSSRDGNVKTMPTRFLETALVEAIDASGTELIYEGFDNLIGLRHLRSLSLRNCRHIDDWCLPKLLIHSKTLQHLDLSGCPNITERGLSWLYHLSNLRTLVVEDMPRVENKEYVSLLLEDELPLLEVQGVEYNSTPSQITQQEQILLEERSWKDEGVALSHNEALPDYVEVGNPNVPRSISEKKKEEVGHLMESFNKRMVKMIRRKPTEWRP